MQLFHKKKERNWVTGKVKLAFFTRRLIQIYDAMDYLAFLFAVVGLVFCVAVILRLLEKIL